MLLVVIFGLVTHFRFMGSLAVLLKIEIYLDFY